MLAGRSSGKLFPGWGIVPILKSGTHSLFRHGESGAFRWPDDALSGPWLRDVDAEWAEPRAVSPDQLLQMPQNYCLLNSTKIHQFALETVYTHNYYIGYKVLSKLTSCVLSHDTVQDQVSSTQCMCSRERDIHVQIQLCTQKHICSR